MKQDILLIFDGSIDIVSEVAIDKIYAVVTENSNCSFSSVAALKAAVIHSTFTTTRNGAINIKITYPAAVATKYAVRY